MARNTLVNGSHAERDGGVSRSPFPPLPGYLRRMPVRPEPDVSQARWFSERDEPWVQLCSIGPTGFERYARLFHPARPGADVTDPHHLEDLEGHLETDVLHLLLGVLGRHTSTPHDCFFGLWDGFGDIHGSPSVAWLVSDRRAAREAPPAIPPAFPPEVLSGPRVSIPARDYLLFRGPLDQAGEWGAADLRPGQPGPINSPNLMWPADRAWFVTTEIDLPWTGVGGSAELIRDLKSEKALDMEEVELMERPPYWRTGGDSGSAP